MAKVLIGDDNTSLIRSLERALSGIEVDYSETPEGVIEKAKVGNYDAIVTDMNYERDGTGKEGLEVLDAIKDLSPVRVLFSTAVNYPMAVTLARQKGATHLISKENSRELISLLRGI